jgi:hypothetical protein
MAAGLGFKDFQTGEVLTAADVDGYLMQGVWVFASAAARDAAVTSPQEGNFAYLKDTNATTYYTGSAWANVDTTGGGLTLLSTTTLSGASTTISPISQDYKSLYVVITGYTYTGSSDALAVKPNGVTTGIESTSQYSIGTTPGSVASVNSIFFINYIGTTVADAENSFVLVIDNYTSTSTNKPMMSYGQSLHSGGTRSTCLSYGGDRQNSAISSLEFLINAGGTSFTGGTVLLYGVK